MNVFLVLLYIVCLVIIPGYVWYRLSTKYGALDAISLPLVVTLGLIFNIISSALFRTTAGSLEISINYYFLLHALFILPLWFELKNSRYKLNLQSFMTQFNRQHANTLLFYAFSISFLIYLGSQSTKEFHQFYHDEHQRLSIVHFIKLAYPPPEFHIFSDTTYRYYNIPELFAANISEFTGVSAEWVYLKFLIVFNWFLIFLGFHGILNYKKTNSHFITILLFIFFILIEGYASGQKHTHFAFRQNTFALACILLSASNILKFLETRKFLYFIFSILIGAFAVGSKTIAFAVLTPVIPLIGVYAYFKKVISFKKLIFAGMVSAIFVFGWYGLIVYNPVAESKALLIFNPNHGSLIDNLNNLLAHPNALLKFLKTIIESYGINANIFLVPIFFSLEYIAFIALSIAFRGQSKWNLTDTGLWILLLGSIFSMAIFSLFSFNISSSSIVYPLFFGSWCFNVFSCSLLYQTVNRENYKKIVTIIVGMFLISVNTYAFDLISVGFDVPQNQNAISTNELQGFEELKKHTDPNDYVMHNYYVMDSMWSFAALAARKAIVTSHSSEGINQNRKLYLKVLPEVDKFFQGQYSDLDQSDFLTRYKVSGIFWVKRFHAITKPDIPGFKSVYENAEVAIWVKEKI